MATHSSILAWRIPLAENPGSYSPLDTTEQLSVSLYTELDSKFRDFPNSPVVWILPSNAGGVDSIPGQRTKILRALQAKTNKQTKT